MFYLFVLMFTELLVITYLVGKLWKFRIGKLAPSGFIYKMPIILISTLLVNFMPVFLVFLGAMGIIEMIRHHLLSQEIEAEDELEKARASIPVDANVLPLHAKKRPKQKRSA